uniref:Ovule protein n=1 Tax=Heterorhabditis bacteriophora TaxID=37862 RepID=A0A1I7X5G8_HETBA
MLQCREKYSGMRQIANCEMKRSKWNAPLLLVPLATPTLVSWIENDCHSLDQGHSPYELIID